MLTETSQTENQKEKEMRKRNKISGNSEMVINCVTGRCNWNSKRGREKGVEEIFKIIVTKNFTKSMTLN
jgi:hypothetical protein